jgi:hypothetical protein
MRTITTSPSTGIPKTVFELCDPLANVTTADHREATVLLWAMLLASARTDDNLWTVEPRLSLSERQILGGFRSARIESWMRVNKTRCERHLIKLGYFCPGCQHGLCTVCNDIESRIQCPMCQKPFPQIPSEDQHTRQRQFPGTRWGAPSIQGPRPRVENRGPGEEVPSTARDDSQTPLTESTFGCAVERSSACPTGMVPCAYAKVRNGGMVVCACRRASRSNLQDL